MTVIKLQSHEIIKNDINNDKDFVGYRNGSYK